MEDVLPNQQSGILEIPEERKLEEESVLQDLIKSKPVLQDLLDWFDESIAQTDSISSLQLDNFTQENDLRAQILAKVQLKMLLTSKRSELWSKIQALKEETNG